MLANMDLDPKLNIRKNKEYKVESIKDSVVYAKEAKANY